MLIRLHLTYIIAYKTDNNDMQEAAFEGAATQRAKFIKKVHKPPLGVNVIKLILGRSPRYIVTIE